jgi:hypothetical protein
MGNILSLGNRCQERYKKDLSSPSTLCEISREMLCHCDAAQVLVCSLLYVFAPGIARVSDSGTEARASALISAQTPRRRCTEVPIMDEQHEYLKIPEVMRPLR